MWSYVTISLLIIAAVGLAATLPQIINVLLLGTVVIAVPVVVRILQVFP